MNKEISVDVRKVMRQMHRVYFETDGTLDMWRCDIVKRVAIRFGLDELVNLIESHKARY